MPEISTKRENKVRTKGSFSRSSNHPPTTPPKREGRIKGEKAPRLNLPAAAYCVAEKRERGKVTARALAKISLLSVG